MFEYVKKSLQLDVQQQNVLPVTLCSDFLLLLDWLMLEEQHTKENNKTHNIKKLCLLGRLMLETQSKTKNTKPTTQY